MPDPVNRPASWLRRLLFGKSLSLSDRSVFHNLSLIAFFAWVGLGADGLSSSCYGPAEAYLALGKHGLLAVFVALASAATIIIISAAYSQIIERFPTGGGGYMVASTLLSPTLGMVSGCALLIDYVLTIAISIASGTDAVFSFLPVAWLPYRLPTAVAGIVALTLLNLRGVKESIQVLVPIFLVFVLSHALGITYGLWTHAMDLPALATRVGEDLQAARTELGSLGMFLLVLHAYSMGAGTFTGIEAVSNGLPILREPKAQTGKRTMLYMAASLSLTVVGLILCFILYRVAAVPGKTLNAVLFEAMAANFGSTLGGGFVLTTLVSEALLLFVAAQTGFVGGPRVLANMALDRWLPSRFALLSDRLVTQNGITLMGAAGLIVLVATDGAVDILIVLYSINVFVTFVLAQLGMVRHWWQARHTAARWGKGLFINGLGLVLTASILVMVTAVKFFEGGWVTIAITGTLILAAVWVRRHYDDVGRRIRKLDVLRAVVDPGTPTAPPIPKNRHGLKLDLSAPTAVIFVNGFTGLGVHTLLSVARYFGKDIANYVFVQIGLVDAAVFQSPDELDRLKEEIAKGLDKYVSVMTERGYHAESHWAVGTDIVQEVLALVPGLHERFPKALFFGGQLVFEKDTFLTRLLHNYAAFSLQRQIYQLGLPFMVMPARLDPSPPRQGAETA